MVNLLVSTLNTPDGASAKKATDVAFNENVSALASDLEAKYNLKSLFLGDMASRNAIELHSIIVNREDQGKAHWFKSNARTYQVCR